MQVANVVLAQREVIHQVPRVDLSIGVNKGEFVLGDLLDGQRRVSERKESLSQRREAFERKRIVRGLMCDSHGWLLKRERGW